MEYRDLPSVSNAVEALDPKAPQLHEQIPGNLALDFETGNEATTAAAFSKAARTVSINVHNNRVIAQPLEPRACAATYDAAAMEDHGIAVEVLAADARSGRLLASVDRVLTLARAAPAS